MATILKKIKPVLRSIRLRLVATYFVVISLALLLMIAYILSSIKDYSVQKRQMEMLTKANILASFAAENTEAFAEGSTAPEALLGVDDHSRILLLDKDGRVSFDTAQTNSRRGKILSLPWVLKALGGKNSAEVTTDNDLHYMSAAVPMYHNGEIVGALVLKASIEDLYDFYGHIEGRLIAIAVIGSLVIGLFGFFLSAIFTAPLSNLTVKIKEMSETDSREPVEIHGGKEITELVSAFNVMVGRINDIDNRRREFVSNASHELKTPLSSIKLICDSLLQNPDTDKATVDEFLTDMNDQVDRLTRIINKLLSLTKLDSSVHAEEIFEFTTVNMRALTENVVKALLPLAQQKNIMLETMLREDLFLRVDADKMWEALYNIIDNSIKYTPPDGRVYVELYRDGNQIFITVADNGIGMAESEFAKIFDRFYRVDKARSRDTGGTGLGLSIALSAVELHGGYIEVESREDEGSLFRIVLPVANEL